MNAKLKLAAVAVGILIALLSLLALLEIHRFQQLLIEVESSLVSVPAQALKADVERSLAFGLPLRENSRLGVMVDQVNQQYPNILSIHLVDAERPGAAILWQSGPPLDAPDKILQSQQRTPKAMWFGAKDASGFIQAWPITDPLGNRVANLVVRFDKAKTMALVAQASNYLMYVWAGLCIAVLLILVPLLLQLLNGLDRIVAQARGIIEGAAPPNEQHSEIGQLAMQIADLRATAAGKEAKL